MNLTSMKTTPAEAKEEAKEMIGEASTQPQYPYGLSIYIDDAAMAKLGITTMPGLGTKMMMTAQVEVCAASMYQRQGADDESNLTLQITDMALDAPGPSIEDRLYKKA